MRVWPDWACAAAAVWLTVGLLVSSAQAEPLRIFYFNWAGFGPLFLAQEKGFFAEEGIEVELINVEETHAAYAGLFGGHVDAVAAVLQDIPFFSTPDETLVCVLITEDSRGADGIVANQDIKSITDLKGKAVAFETGSISRFYLSVLLEDAGLSEADIEPVELGAEDAGNAFMLQEVDAAVTWEPFLTQGRQSAHGHVLVDSSQMPGLIVDCLLAKATVWDERLADFQAVARAWDAAVAHVETHPNEANEIMARHVGGWLEDPAVFAQTLEGVRFPDAERNRELFGTPDAPGQIYETSQYAIDVWSSLGMLDIELSPADVIRHGVWGE